MARAEAGPLLRYRRQIGAEHIRIFADVKKKHAAHALTADVALAEAARTCEFFDADSVIVTGTATGHAATACEAAEIKASVAIPVLIGSGVTVGNVAEFWPHADGFIVGSEFKHGGLWSNPIDPDRVERFVRRVAGLRGV